MRKATHITRRKRRGLPLTCDVCGRVSETHTHYSYHYRTALSGGLAECGSCFACEGCEDKADQHYARHGLRLFSQYGIGSISPVDQQ